MQEFKCPFMLHAVYGQAIRCEMALIKLPDRVARKEFLDKFCGCGDNYKKCPFYEILDNYYKRIYDDWNGDDE